VTILRRSFVVIEHFLRTSLQWQAINGVDSIAVVQLLAGRARPRRTQAMHADHTPRVCHRRPSLCEWRTLR